MVDRWLSWLNSFLLVVTLFLLGGMVFLWIYHPSAIVCSYPISKDCGLPKGAFTMPSEAYERIEEPLLVLQSTPPTLQLPDLRQNLIYYGKNGRPDAQSNHTFLHFSLNGSKAVVSIPPGEPLYLRYDKKSVPCHYVFSPHNEKTSLWAEAIPEDNEAVVKIFITNDKGELITEPENYAQFKLPEKEFIRYTGSTWEIGSWRVDATLLARQRARWYGPDYFLERHGGEEYQDIAGKQRIDLGENDDIYSIFVKVGDCLIWDGTRWKSITPGEDSLKHPLLVIKKIDERLMTFELWDVEGKGKVLLNLLKSSEPWLAQNVQSIQHTFKFVGARTRTQYVFEINRERMLISPSDWLLLTTKGWKKLTTDKEIDNYVKRKINGTLFVFEGLVRKEERQFILGTLYNPSRNDYQSVEIPTQPRGTKLTESKEQKEEDDEDDDEDDDDEDDDDEKSNAAMQISEMEKGRSPFYPPAPSIPQMLKDQTHTR